MVIFIVIFVAVAVVVVVVIVIIIIIIVGVRVFGVLCLESVRYAASYPRMLKF